MEMPHGQNFPLDQFYFILHGNLDSSPSIALAIFISSYYQITSTYSHYGGIAEYWPQVDRSNSYRSVCRHDDAEYCRNRLSRGRKDQGTDDCN